MVIQYRFVPDLRYRLAKHINAYFFQQNVNFNRRIRISCKNEPVIWDTLILLLTRCRIWDNFWRPQNLSQTLN